MAELRIWPCEVFAKPRSWGIGDGVWRPVLQELAEHVAADISCPVTTLWMHGDEIERAVSPPGLQGRGFLCWGKGEREPKGDGTGSFTAAVGMSAANLRIMPQGEDAWH